jgi:hypothetical protein
MFFLAMVRYPLLVGPGSELFEKLMILSMRRIRTQYLPVWHRALLRQGEVLTGAAFMEQLLAELLSTCII